MLLCDNILILSQKQETVSDCRVCKPSEAPFWGPDGPPCAAKVHEKEGCWNLPPFSIFIHIFRHFKLFHL